MGILPELSCFREATGISKRCTSREHSVTMYSQASERRCSRCQAIEQDLASLLLLAICAVSEVSHCHDSKTSVEIEGWDPVQRGVLIAMTTYNLRRLI